ncbi:MAG: NAD-dependent epimerase/dehydratase family protein [Clostridiales Family XIII bacterium]|jgi:nucleoside-diphosphate-sugar epimerase|nr:NAD-dependent epimerase/dehydratase family protein [Clostridiales Family XIII bacterium]
MKALLIGGSGNISSAISKQLAAEGHELYLLNRGNKSHNVPEGANVLIGDIHNEAEISKLLDGQRFDVVADFVAFAPEDVERDYRLFNRKTDQYIFISSANTYQKPLVSPITTETSPQSNPFWTNSSAKIDCEKVLYAHFQNDRFPITIVRPSHTYGEEFLPLSIQGANGPWSVVSRMLRGKPVLIQGDGTIFWTVTYNTDFAEAFIGLMGNPHAIGQAVNVMGEECLTWNQIYELIAKKLGVELKPLHVTTDLLIAAEEKYGYNFTGGLLGDKSNTAIFDTSKLKSLVPGYVGAIRFDQALETIIPNFLSNPALQVEDPAFDAFSDRVAEALHAAEQSLLA